MRVRTLGSLLVALLAVAGCSAKNSSQTVSGGETTQKASPGAPASFVNRVWVVAESKQVALGELRVFLSEGTLVMASPHGTPALGKWRHDAGRLTITEEGREYQVEILELSQDVFHIQIHGPGEPVDIRFQSAGQPPAPTP